jgi:hypothetical protein
MKKPSPPNDFEKRGDNEFSTPKGYLMIFGARTLLG